MKIYRLFYPPDDEEPSDGCAGIRVLRSRSRRRIYPFSAERRNYSLITRTITRWRGLTNQKETSGTRARLTAFGTCTIHIEYFHHPFASTALSAGVHNPPEDIKKKKIHRGVSDRNDRTVCKGTERKNTIKPLELGPRILLLRCLIGPSFGIPPLKR